MNTENMTFDEFNERRAEIYAAFCRDSLEALRLRHLPRRLTGQQHAAARGQATRRFFKLEAELYASHKANQ